MPDQFSTVQFENDINPRSSFDLLRLETFMQRDDLEISPNELHKVEFYVIIIVTGGIGYHTIDFTDYKLVEGTVLLIRKDQIHKFFKSDSLRGYMLLFTNDFIESYLDRVESIKTLQLFNELLGRPKITLSPTQLANKVEMITRMEHEYLVTKDDFSLSIVRSLLHILITKLFRIKYASANVLVDNAYIEPFTHFQSLVETNIFASNRVSEYANKLAISTKTLNNITRSIVNKSAKEFIDEIYIKQIKRMLLNTNHSVKEIAYATGFNETSNFYKYFKRHIGITPEQFRALR